MKVTHFSPHGNVRWHSYSILSTSYVCSYGLCLTSLTIPIPSSISMVSHFKVCSLKWFVTVGLIIFKNINFVDLLNFALNKNFVEKILRLWTISKILYCTYVANTWWQDLWSFEYLLVIQVHHITFTKIFLCPCTIGKTLQSQRELGNNYVW